MEREEEDRKGSGQFEISVISKRRWNESIPGPPNPYSFGQPLQRQQDVIFFSSFSFAMFFQCSLSTCALSDYAGRNIPIFSLLPDSNECWTVWHLLGGCAYDMGDHRKAESCTNSSVSPIFIVVLWLRFFMIWNDYGRIKAHLSAFVFFQCSFCSLNILSIALFWILYFFVTDLPTVQWSTLV